MMPRHALPPFMLAVVMVLAVPTVPAWSDGYDDANRLYWAGKVEEAWAGMIPLAEGGDARAQFWVGSRYIDGRGTQRNDARAVDWITKAAEGGNAQAQFNLGVFYRDGMRGVTKDLVAAKKWLGLSAAQGYAPAKSELSTLTAPP
jgi:uncharacterized protein